MKGVGSYNNDWPYYASPSSNLSAFAAPFSVNRPPSSDVVSASFMDSSESADSVVPSNPIQFPPVQPRSYGYDFFSNPVRELDSTPPSKPYGYSGLQVLEPSSSQLPHFNSLGLSPVDSFPYDQCSSTSKPSIVEAQPYYPSYIPSQLHDPTPSLAPPNPWPSSSSGFASFQRSSVADYADKSPDLGFTGQRAGLWNQFPELNHVKSMQVGVGSSFSSNQAIAGSVVEERMDQGCQDVKDSINGEGSHMIGWEKQYVPLSADQLDGKSSWWGSIKPMPVESPGTSVMASPSVSLETNDDDPPLKVPDSGNCHLSYTGSYDKYLRQHDKPLRVETVSSTPITGLVTDLNIGNFLTDGDLGNKNFYNLKEAYRRPSPGTAGCFDIGHLHMHLDGNEPSSSNNAMIADKNVSGDVVDYIFKEMHGFQDSHANLDNLSLRLSSNENVNSGEKSFDGADRCNPAVDSPCWKGSPAGHFSHYEVSEALPPEYLHKNEKCFGSVIQEPQSSLVDTDNSVKKSCENSNNYQMQNENSHQETNLAGSTRKFSVAKFASENCNFDGAVNTGPLQSEPTIDYGLKCLKDTTEMKANNVLSTKPIHDCGSGSSHSEHHFGLNRFMLQSLETSLADGADAGSNVNNGLECGKSHMEEHSSSSTSSVVDGPTTLEKSAGKVSTQKLNIRMLVDRMHNLSELLLMHFSDDACEEQDWNVLKDVITNLNTCVSKKAERITPFQECLFPQPGTSRSAGQSCKLQQNASFENHQVTQVGPESCKVDLENPFVQDTKNLHPKSEILVKKLSDSISPTGDAEMKNEDSMTKALKRILSENFHDDEGVESQGVLYKNLWLEAEAALCSISYKARYNQMKIEMEKYKQKGMEEQSSLCRSQSLATKVHIDPSSDSSVQDSAVLNAANLKDPSNLKFFVDINKPDAFIQNSTVSESETKKEAADDEASVMARFYVLKALGNKPNALTPEGKTSQDLDSLIQNSIVSESDTKKEAADDEASVMARFHVLKARGNESCLNAVNVEELSHITANSPPRERESQNQVNFCHDFPIPRENKANDYEASVVTRFHILKSRVEDSSSLSSEEKLLDDGFAGKGTDDRIVTTKASEGKSLDVHVYPSVMHLSSYGAVDTITKELHFDWEDHEEIEPCGTNEFGNLLPTYHSDGLSLDWEHVEKRSLLG